MRYAAEVSTTSMSFTPAEPFRPTAIATVNEDVPEPAPRRRLAAAPTNVSRLVSNLLATYELALELYGQWKKQKTQHNHYHRRGKTARGGAVCALTASLVASPPRIKEAYDAGFTIAGPDFYRGDATCREVLWAQIDQMKDRIILLQGAIIAGGGPLDLADILHASELTRKVTLTALGDLYHQLARGRSIPQELSLLLPTAAVRGPDLLSPKLHEVEGSLPQQQGHSGSRGSSRQTKRDSAHSRLSDRSNERSASRSSGNNVRDARATASGLGKADPNAGGNGVGGSGSSGSSKRKQSEPASSQERRERPFSQSSIQLLPALKLSSHVKSANDDTATVFTNPFQSPPPSPPPTPMPGLPASQSAAGTSKSPLPPANAAAVDPGSGKDASRAPALPPIDVAAANAGIPTKNAAGPASHGHAAGDGATTPTKNDFSPPQKASWRPMPLAPPPSEADLTPRSPTTPGLPLIPSTPASIAATWIPDDQSVFTTSSSGAGAAGLRPKNSVFALFCPEAMALQVDVTRPLPGSNPSSSSLANPGNEDRGRKKCKCGYRWRMLGGAGAHHKGSGAGLTVGAGTAGTATAASKEDLLSSAGGGGGSLGVVGGAVLLKEGFRLTERFLAKSHCEGEAALESTGQSVGRNSADGGERAGGTNGAAGGSGGVVGTGATAGERTFSGGFGCVLCLSSGKTDRYESVEDLRVHINAAHSKWQMLHDRDLK